MQYLLPEYIFIRKHWNFSETIQAIMRGYRFHSHNDLLNSDPLANIVLNVYLRVSLNNESINSKNGHFSDGVKSIDLLMYEISERKEIGLTQMLDLMKISAVDCAFNYERNKNPHKPYQCASGMIKDTDEIDYSSFDLYFSDDLIDKLVEEIKLIFSQNFSFLFNDLFNKISSNNEKHVTMALKKIIETNILIVNKYGFTNFLREDKNFFFLVENNNTVNNLFSEYYTSNINISGDKKYSDILIDYQKLFNDEQMNFLKNYKKNGINDELLIKNILIKLPIHIQQNIIENSLTAKLINNQSFLDSRDIIIKFYENFITTILDPNSPQNYEYSYHISSFNPDQKRCLREERDLEDGLSFFNVWIDCDQYVENMWNIKQENRKNEIENNDIGFYGQFSKQTNEFCLVKNDDDKSIGKRCLNWNRSELLNIIIFHLSIIFEGKLNDSYISILSKIEKLSNDDLESEINESSYLKELFAGKKFNREEMTKGLLFEGMKIKELCDLIRVELEEKDLLVENINCGNQIKRKN